LHAFLSVFVPSGSLCELECCHSVGHWRQAVWMHTV
jgi:hypothetical protein